MIIPPIEGKTKKILPLTNQPGLGLVISKDDVTAGDGAKHDVAAGKAVLANATTCHVFDMLKRYGVPLAYRRRNGDSFVTELVDMIPVEVVVRNAAAGSYCKRNPEVTAGHEFRRPVVEYFYKTSGRVFQGMLLSCDDPLLLFSEDSSWLALYHPAKELDHERPLLEVTSDLMSVVDRQLLITRLRVCGQLALTVNKHLRAAWDRVGGYLVDCKTEYGVNAAGKIVLADVLDCDSWRVLWKTQQLSKQPYRDGASVADLLKVYKVAERLTRKFN